MGRQKLEIGPPNCIHNYPGRVLEYIGHLALRNIVGEIFEKMHTKFHLQICGVQPHL